MTAVHGRLDRVEGCLGKMDGRLGKMENRLGKVEDRQLTIAGLIMGTIGIATTVILYSL